MRKFLAHSLVRWAAVILLLFAYVLVSQGIISARGVAYNAINAIGSILLIVNSLSAEKRDWSIAVFNMVWVGIALVTVILSLR